MLPVNDAISIFVSHPKATQEEILHALTQGGAAPLDAWRLYQFLPIACAHALFESKGVRFQPDYLIQHHTTNQRTAHPFAMEPLYVAARTAATEHVHKTDDPTDMIAVARHSAEFATIAQFLKNGSALADLVLAEPILFEYDPAWDASNSMAESDT